MYIFKCRYGKDFVNNKKVNWWLGKGEWEWAFGKHLGKGIPVFRNGHMNHPSVLFRIVPAWSPKNKEGFRTGCMDFPRVLFWIVQAWSLKNWDVFRIECVHRPCILFRIVPA